MIRAALTSLLALACPAWAGWSAPQPFDTGPLIDNASVQIAQPPPGATLVEITPTFMLNRVSGRGWHRADVGSTLRATYYSRLLVGDSGGATYWGGGTYQIIYTRPDTAPFRWAGTISGPGLGGPPFVTSVSSGPLVAQMQGVATCDWLGLGGYTGSCHNHLRVSGTLRWWTP